MNLINWSNRIPSFPLTIAASSKFTGVGVAWHDISYRFFLGDRPRNNPLKSMQQALLLRQPLFFFKENKICSSVCVFVLFEIMGFYRCFLKYFVWAILSYAFYAETYRMPMTKSKCEFIQINYNRNVILIDFSLLSHTL